MCNMFILSIQTDMPGKSDTHIRHSRMWLLIRIYTVSFSSSTSWTHQQIAKRMFPINRESMVRAEMSKYFEGNIEQKIPVQTAWVHICY